MKVYGHPGEEPPPSFERRAPRVISDRWLAALERGRVGRHHRLLDRLVRASRIFCDVYRWETGRDMQIRHDGRMIVGLYKGRVCPIDPEAVIMASDHIALFARVFSDLEIMAGDHPAWNRRRP